MEDRAPSHHEHAPPPIDDVISGRLTINEWRAAHRLPSIESILQSVASEYLKPALMFERLCWAAWEARERRTNPPDGPHYLAWDKAPDWNGRDEMRMMVRAMLTELRTPSKRMMDAADDTEHTIEAIYGFPDWRGQIAAFLTAGIDSVIAEGDANG